MKPEPFLDYEFLANEYELAAMLDAIPCEFKTKKFWELAKRLCPEVLLATLMPSALGGYR